MFKNKGNQTICCHSDVSKKGKGFLSGLCWGLLPHCGCLFFIIFTVLGVSAISSFFKSLLMNSYFFYGLIILSLFLTTISAIIYLKKNRLLSLEGAKIKWKYLLTLYGTAMIVNIILFMVVFPYVTNLSMGYSSKSTAAINQKTLSKLTLKVDIPCSGHALLIISELKKNNGIYEVRYRLPDLFDVYYDSLKMSKETIVFLDIFRDFKARILST